MFCKLIMVEVSIVLPVYNAEPWLDECLQSVVNQDCDSGLELSVYNDASTDQSMAILNSWKERLRVRRVSLVVSENKEDKPKGVGYAKNRSIEQSSGSYLCFLDADDVMRPERVRIQLQAAQQLPDAIVGCKFFREPDGSTERYTKWANTITQEQLYTQAFTSHGPTVIMPTWFCHRSVYEKVGGFDENGKGTPEDLIFFYNHLKSGGKVHRVNETLLMYRYHPQATTFSVLEETIWRLRVQTIQDMVLKHWGKFTIWNAGKQGRHFYRSLSEENRVKVEIFCDVDEKKLQKGHYTYEESKEMPKPKVPIVHYTIATGPFIICVKQDLTGGGFEENLRSLNLTEGKDYYHFN